MGRPSRDTPGTDLFDLWLLLVHTRDVIGKIRQKELNQYKLTARQSAVLRVIHESGNNATRGEISRGLFRELHSVSEHLSRMEKAGLVKKSRRPEKNGLIRISLTPKGQDAYEESARRESIRRTLSCLSEEQRNQIRSCLQLLLEKATAELHQGYPVASEHKNDNRVRPPGNSRRQKVIRVLLAKLGLDGHDRGIKVVGATLRNAGMEVIYTGIRQTPEAVAKIALEEDVDVIGLSSLSGGHMVLFPLLMKKLKKQGQNGVIVVVGGVIPTEDYPTLKKIGIKAIFGPGTFTAQIVETIKNLVAEKEQLAKTKT